MKIENTTIMYIITRCQIIYNVLSGIRLKEIKNVGKNPEFPNYILTFIIRMKTLLVILGLKINLFHAYN